MEQEDRSHLSLALWVRPECKDITARVQYIKVGDCKSEEEVDINYCQMRALGSEDRSLHLNTPLFRYIVKRSGKFMGECERN